MAIVIGISFQNFRDIVSLFQKNDAVRIVGAAELPLVFMELVDSPAVRKALGHRALETLKEHRGATEKTMRALAGMLSTTWQDAHAKRPGP